MSIPPYAEFFLRTDFVTMKQGPASKLLPGKHQSPVEEFFCPCCGIENEPPHHSIERKCIRCSARWVSHGNHLALWKEPLSPQKRVGETE